MDFFRLPIDVKEIIASSLPPPDLANAAGVDPELQSFFRKKVAPTFVSEFVRISKIFKYLEKIFHMKVSSHDIVEDGGDQKIMSYILDREVEEGEIFEDDTEYAIWKTMNATIDLEPNMSHLIDTFVYQRNDFNEFIDHDIDDILDEYWEEHGYIPGDYF